MRLATEKIVQRVLRFNGAWALTPEQQVKYLIKFGPKLKCDQCGTLTPKILLLPESPNDLKLICCECAGVGSREWMEKFLMGETEGH